MSVDILRMCLLSVVLTVFQREAKTVCAATLCSPPCLLVSTTTDILAIDYKTAEVRSIISGLTGAVALDVHFRLGYIFWSDVTERNIKRFNIDKTSTTTVITDIGVCDGLAVDWRVSQLYWTDKTQDTISVSDLDGSNQSVLITSDLDEPRAIALDLDNRLMIWSDAGTHPKIEKASLSGNQRVSVVTTDIFHPNGIELDRGNKRIFWVDAGYDRVESVKYDGSSRKILFRQDGLHPSGLVLIAPFLFFIDWKTQRELHKLEATIGKVLGSYSINGGKPMSIVAYDNSRQPSAPSACAVNNGGCSHFCVTKSSGYECACQTGLALKEDGKKCEDRVRKFILFADADDMSTNFISLDVDYFVSQTFFKHLGNQRPIALDFDPVEDRVYWSDVYYGRIFSAFSNATSSKTLFYCNVQTPDGLVIDHVGRNIYWTDSGTDRIEVGRLDGTIRKVLIKDGLDKPRAIALAVRKGMMFWTDWGTIPKIEQAEMDGSARQTIVTGNLGFPNGLTFNQATNCLFWADAKLDKIEVLYLSEGKRQLISSTAANIHPYGLAVYQDMLYWTDWNTKSISRFNISSGKQETIVYGLKKPMDIHVFDPSLIFSGPHNCSQNNGLCSDFCLLKPEGYQCACPTGIALKSDGKTCNYETFYKPSSEKFMIIAESYRHVGNIYKIPVKVPETPCFPLGINTKISGPVAVDYDPVEGKVYWTDVILKLVARAFPNGSSVEVIADINVDNPEGLAVDYVGRNVYWTDEGSNKIEIARLDGSSRRSLITSNIERPRAILLDIGERKMYWGGSGVSLKIEQANMDGSARTTLVTSGLKLVNSLAMDYQNRLLYWCDSGVHKIERIDLQGNNRKVIVDISPDKIHPFGLAVFSNAVFWSDLIDSSVHKYNMSTLRTEVFFRGMGIPMGLHIYDQSNDYFALKCPALPAPPNGIRQGCIGTTTEYHNTVCLFSCNAGFNATGSPSRRCLGNRTWSGQDFLCQAVTCPPLSTPPRAILLNASCGNTSGSSCVFGCQSGYVKADGNVTRTCLLTGQWSGSSIRCIERKKIVLEHTSSLAVVVGSSIAVCVLIVLILVAVLFWRKRGSRIRERPDFIEDENLGQNNPGYQDRVKTQHSYPEDVELQQADHGICRGFAERDQINEASSDIGAAAGSSKLSALDEGGTSKDKDSVDWSHFVSSLSNEPITEKHIYQVSPDIGRDWKDVLRSLSMKEKAIENLSEDYKYDRITEQCIQGLLKWKELDPQLATIKTLAIALLGVRCIDALQTLRNYHESNTSDC